MDDIKSNIAKNIADLRLSRGMTQFELAQKLSYSDKAVSKWERGESIPDVTVLVAIASLFGVTLDYLVSCGHSENDKNDENDENGAEALSDANSKNGKIDRDEKKKRDRIIITEISMLLVWFIATAVFLVLSLALPMFGARWLSFVYAVPMSTVVWLVFNSVWFDRHLNYFIVSLLIWSLLCSIYLTVLAVGYNLGLIFILGVPSQLIIIMCSRFANPSPKKIKGSGGASE